ncbi:unnamed protein product [Trichobilharzia szidati]|nr:unnamed protein product [Trichobilharzia szidati]
MERVNTQVKTLSTRLKYLSRYVIQQKHQLNSALAKITALEEQLSAHLSKCTLPCTKRSIGCQVSPKSKPSVTLSSSRKHSVTLSPNMSDVSSSSSSKSFNGTIQWLQTTSNSVDEDRPKMSNKLEIKKCQAVNSLSSQRLKTPVAKKRRRSSVLPPSLRKVKKVARTMSNKSAERN